MVVFEAMTHCVILRITLCNKYQAVFFTCSVLKMATKKRVFQCGLRSDL